MHEILILYILLDAQNTMYGIFKVISKNFGFITNPSFGTIDPALKRLQKQNYVISNKLFSDGGKPYYYYSITPEDKEFLIKKIKEKPCLNPIQAYPEIKIKLICSNILDDSEKKSLYKLLKPEIIKIKTKAEEVLKSEVFSANHFARIVVDNTVCECKNMYDLIEGLEKCLQ